MRAMIVKTRCKKIDDCRKVADLLRDWLATRNEVDRDKEHFWAIGLDTKLGLKYVELVTLGTLDASLVHPREVFRYAIMKGVASIILGHNHPSGDTEPSYQDRDVTKRLATAGKLLGIQVIDHLIIGLSGDQFSFAESLPHCLIGD